MSAAQNRPYAGGTYWSVWGFACGLEPRTIGRGGVRFRPFQIPLRSLIAKDADNLFMAGRCISGGFVPHGSYRVTGSAVAMGEAIGIHAAKVAMAAHAS